MSNLHQQYRKVEALDSCVVLFREQHERLDFITERRCTELLKKKKHYMAKQGTTKLYILC